MTSTGQLTLPLRDGAPDFGEEVPCCLVCGGLPAAHVRIRLPIEGSGCFSWLLFDSPGATRRIRAPLCARHRWKRRGLLAAAATLIMGSIFVICYWSFEQPRWLQGTAANLVGVAVGAGVIAGFVLRQSGRTGGVQADVREAGSREGFRELLVWDYPEPGILAAIKAIPEPVREKLPEDQGYARDLHESADASRTLGSDQISLARGTSGQLWFGERQRFCLACGGHVAGEYTAWHFSDQGRARLEIPLCAVHLSRARAWRYAAWVSLLCYPAAILALSFYRTSLHLEELPDPWDKVAIAGMLVPMVALWWKKDRAPVPAKIDLVDGGSRLILTYPYRTPEPL